MDYRPWLVAVSVLCLGAAPLAAVELPADIPGPELPLPGADVGTRMRAAQDGERLAGLFAISAGECEPDGTPAGSYFRMVQPGGDPERGPYVDNGDSPCSDRSATPLSPGTDHGLATTGFQPHPDPVFDTTGNGRNDRVFQPARFFGTRFAVGTGSPDRQTGQPTSPPEILHDGRGGLSGQVTAFDIAWNGQHFNQGAPKPDGSAPGLTTDGVSGTYDAGTGAFELMWVSTISGGAFNGFSGVWHFEGTFQPAAAPAPPPSSPASSAPDTIPAAAGATPVTGAAAPTAQALADTGPGLPARTAWLVLLAAAAALVASRRLGAAR